MWTVPDVILHLSFYFVIVAWKLKQWILCFFSEAVNKKFTCAEHNFLFSVLIFHPKINVFRIFLPYKNNLNLHLRDFRAYRWSIKIGTWLFHCEAIKFSTPSMWKKELFSRRKMKYYWNLIIYCYCSIIIPPPPS